MNSIGRIISVAIYLGIAASFFASEGITGLGLVIALSVVGLSVEVLCRRIIRSKRGFSTGLMAGLLVSVIFIALLLFTIAIMSGVETVELIPRWLWYFMIMYSSAVIFFTLRLSDAGVFKHNPDQPPPKAHSG